MKKILIIGFLALISQLAIAQKSETLKEVVTKPETIKSPASEGLPSLHLGSQTVDFGTIQQNSDPVRSLEVINKGVKPLLLSNCSGSCGCTVPTCPMEPIMPGKSAKVQVRYDTSRLGPINKSISITSNDPMTPVKTILVTGNVIAPK